MIERRLTSAMFVTSTRRKRELRYEVKHRNCDYDKITFFHFHICMKWKHRVRTKVIRHPSSAAPMQVQHQSDSKTVQLLAASQVQILKVEVTEVFPITSESSSSLIVVEQLYCGVQPVPLWRIIITLLLSLMTRIHIMHTTLWHSSTCWFVILRMQKKNRSVELLI
jgi:hypothetical protein